MSGGNRLYNAAPGAEAKFRNGPMGTSNGFFGGSSLFPSRTLATRRLVMCCVNYLVFFLQVGNINTDVVLCCYFSDM